MLQWKEVLQHVDKKTLLFFLNHTEITERIERTIPYSTIIKMIECRPDLIENLPVTDNYASCRLP